MGGTRGYTVSTQDVLTSTAPVLPALSDYSLHPRHTQPSGPNAQCPTTQSWFAFHTAASAHVSSHLGSSRSLRAAPRALLVYSTHPLSLRDAGTGATRSCTFDDHTPPSCLIAYPLAKMVYRSVNTLVLPDPWLTQEGPVTFPACALYQLFRQVVRLGASWPTLFTCLCLYTPQLLAASAFLCSFLLSLRVHMDELQNMRLPLGTTEWNHSYYTGNSLSALHSLQQLQAGASSRLCADFGLHTRVT